MNIIAFTQRGRVFCVDRQPFLWKIREALNSSLVLGKISSMASFVNLGTTRACSQSLEKYVLNEFKLLATLFHQRYKTYLI